MRIEPFKLWNGDFIHSKQGRHTALKDTTQRESLSARDGRRNPAQFEPPGARLSALSAHSSIVFALHQRFEFIYYPPVM